MRSAACAYCRCKDSFVVACRTYHITCTTLPTTYFKLPARQLPHTLERKVRTTRKKSHPSLLMQPQGAPSHRSRGVRDIRVRSFLSLVDFVFHAPRSRGPQSPLATYYIPHAFLSAETPANGSRKHTEKVRPDVQTMGGQHTHTQNRWRTEPLPTVLCNHIRRGHALLAYGFPWGTKRRRPDDKKPVNILGYHTCCT
ncbi:unnamed protein product [Ectocarpus sp. 12 AP-2014]